MADVELVIKISEEVYKKAKETHDVMCDSVWLGMKYGTPLPKGHGRLIDADKLRAEYTKPNLVGYDDEIQLIDEQSTIIEADIESEEVEDEE